MDYPVTISTIAASLCNKGITINAKQLNDILTEEGLLCGVPNERTITSAGFIFGIKYQTRRRCDTGEPYQAIVYDESTAGKIAGIIEKRAERGYNVTTISNERKGYLNNRHEMKRLEKMVPNSVIILAGIDKYWAFDRSADAIAKCMDFEGNSWWNSDGKMGITFEPDLLGRIRENLENQGKSYVIREEEFTYIYSINKIEVRQADIKPQKIENDNSPIVEIDVPFCMEDDEIQSWYVIIESAYNLNYIHRADGTIEINNTIVNYVNGMHAIFTDRDIAKKALGKKVGDSFVSGGYKYKITAIGK